METETKLDAEAHYLSCCLCDNTLVDELIAMEYDQEIFAPGKHRNLATAMISIRNRSEQINHVTIIDEMNAAGSFEQSAGWWPWRR